MKNKLVIFLKYPEPGKVKTRLAKIVGDEKAALLYKRFVEHVLKQTKSDKYERYLYFSPIDKKDLFIKWLGNGFKLIPQVGYDLGERLSNAYVDMFDLGADKVVAIGTDCLECDNIIIKKAFDVMEDCEAVIGPTFDGGYYLLGLKSFRMELFKNIEWSTPRVYAETEARFNKYGIGFRSLNKLQDIDTYDDLCDSDFTV